VRAIHQFLPNLDYGDAISAFALEVRDIARAHRCRSRIYVRYFDPRLRAECTAYPRYDGEAAPDDLLLYHYSMGSEITKYFCGLPHRKAIVYHNITPADYFLPYNLTLYNLLQQGREELGRLSAVPALCYSEYSAQELRQLGFSTLYPVPFLWDGERFMRKPDQKVLSAYGDDRCNILFVGRVAPNKRHDDLIKIFYLYTRGVNAHARLLLVGSYGGLEGYHASLQELAGDLGVENVVFTGRVRLRELVGYYRVGDIFLCMSEHEGFSVPLLEAMRHGKCIVTLDKGATSEVIKDGVTGVLLGEDELDALPRCIYELLTDSNRRVQLGSNAKSYADNNFWSWEERMNRELQTVESLVAEWRRAD